MNYFLKWFFFEIEKQVLYSYDLNKNVSIFNLAINDIGFNKGDFIDFLDLKFIYCVIFSVSIFSLFKIGKIVSNYTSTFFREANIIEIPKIKANIIEIQLMNDNIENTIKKIDATLIVTTKRLFANKKMLTKFFDIEQHRANLFEVYDKRILVLQELQKINSKRLDLYSVQDLNNLPLNNNGILEATATINELISQLI